MYNVNLMIVLKPNFLFSSWFLGISLNAVLTLNLFSSLSCFMRSASRLVSLILRLRTSSSRNRISFCFSAKLESVLKDVFSLNQKFPSRQGHVQGDGEAKSLGTPGLNHFVVMYMCTLINDTFLFYLMQYIFLI